MKIGVALGGGGAKGFAHIGILKGLMEAGVKIDVITGTSVGALVGAAFAAGGLADLEKETLNIKLTDVPFLLSPAWSLRGLFSGENAIDMLSQILRCDTIEDLRIPFAAISTDLNSGKIVTLRSGNVRQAVRASISIPALFTPVVVDDMILVDGGTLEPVPVAAARALGADVVIAVDLFGNKDPLPIEKKSASREERASLATSAINHLRKLSSKLPWGEPASPGETPNAKFGGNIVSIIEQTLALSQLHLTELRLLQEPPDLIIRPCVRDIGLLDFHRGSLGVARGAATFLSESPNILRTLETYQQRRISE